MTPKEKAEELVSKYFDTIMSFLSDNMKRMNAKQCAFITVNEILELEDFSIEGREYWTSVKQEIENGK